MPLYRFHDFTLDAGQRRLLGPDGAVVGLTPRLFDALLFFVERPGQLLDKDTLLAALWPGLVVEENSLSQSISALRRALGDDAQSSRYIQTAPRRGFRFIAPVRVEDVAPAPPLAPMIPVAPVAPVAPLAPVALAVDSVVAVPADTAKPPSPGPGAVDAQPQFGPADEPAQAADGLTRQPVGLAPAPAHAPAPGRATGPGPGPGTASGTAPGPEHEPDPVPGPVHGPVPVPEPAHAQLQADAPHTSAPAMQQPARRRLLAGAAAAGVVTLAGAGAAAWRWRANRSAQPRPEAPITLAILPFKPLVLSPRDELLEFGMADSLVARLSNLPGVAVRSMGSVRRYAGPEQDPIGAARDLNVTWIVDGSVQRLGNQVRVSARLLNTASGEAAWSGSFDASFTSMFDLQDTISSKVAQVLAPHLERRGRARLAGVGGTRNIDAYQLYLAARQQAQTIRKARLEKSLQLYQQAIDLDPDYALAYSGLSESWRRMVFGADSEPRLVFAQAGRSLQRALAIAPELAEAHAGAGWNLFWHDWDWPGAEAAFQRAIALNPNEANAHFGYSQLLEMLGRDAEAVEQLRMARELDPLSIILLALESGSLFAAGKRDEARQRLQRVFDIEPDFWVAYMAQGFMLRAEGKTPQAIESLQRSDHFSDGSSQPAAALGNMLARSGDRAGALQVLARLTDAAKSRYVPPTSRGLIHAGLGDTAATLDALEAGFAVRDVRMTLVGRDGRWKLVHDEPRYVALMQRMKLA